MYSFQISDGRTWAAGAPCTTIQTGTRRANVVGGQNVFSYDVKNSIVNVPDDKIVVLQGLDGYIVVESENILLVCRKEDEQRIKQFVNDVKIEKGEDIFNPARRGRGIKKPGSRFFFFYGRWELL
jgi:mannose-1-phosphate guanylyltransferase